MNQNYYFMLIAAAAVAFVSCTKEIDNAQETIQKEVEKMTITVNPSIEMTKSTLNSDHSKIIWSAYDEIRVYNNVDNTSEEITYSAGNPMTVTVPVGTTEIYSQYPSKDNTGGPTKVLLTISNEQTQKNPGELAGRYYPMVAKGTVTGTSANMVFYPVAGALALNIYNSGLVGTENVKSVTVVPYTTSFIGDQSNTDITDSNVAYSSAASSYPICVTLTNTLSIGNSKPSNTKTYDGQIYVCMAKKSYTGIKFIIETDKNCYTKDATAATFDLATNDFLPVNINLATCSTMEESIYERYSGSITEGDYIIYAGDEAMKATISSSRFSYESVTPDGNDCITTDNPFIVWHIKSSGEYWTIFNDAKQRYAASSGAKNQGALNFNGGDDKSLWTIEGTSNSHTIDNKYNAANSLNKRLRQNGTSGFATYADATGAAPILYKLSTKTLSSIAISGTFKTAYYVNDAVDHDGVIVTATYSDATESNVTSQVVFTDPDMSSTGGKTVTVSYTFKGVEKTTTYDITVSERPKFTVTFNDNSSSLTEASVGAGVVLPGRSDSDPWTFAGWAATSISSQTTTAPSTVYIAGSTYYPTSDCTLYPVYTKSINTTTWVLTSLDSVTDGIYILVNDQNYAFSGTLSNEEGGHGVNTSTTITFTNGVATTIPNDACQITFTAVSGGFTMYNASNGYLYAKAAASGNLHWHATESSYWCFKNSNWSYNSNSARLRGYNHATNGFRTYNADNGTLLKLAKKTEVSVTAYISDPS